MALLLFRFCPVFAIGLLLLNGFAVLPASAFVNEAGPDRLRLTVSPPAHVIITATKNTPVYLPCHAEAVVDPNELGVDSDMDLDQDLDEVEYDENNGNEEVDILNPPHIERKGFYEDTFDLHNLAHENIDPNGHGNDLDEEADEEYDEDDQSSRYRRSSYGRDELIEYVWYRNGLEFFSTAFQNQNHKQTHKGFRLFPNGTLKIPYNRQMSNISAGVYRCRANLTRHGSGSILSTESVVSIAYLERNNLLISENNTIMASTHQSLVLHCPFDSHPPANITWIVNRTQIIVNNYAVGPHENRYYQLQNGSLLVTDMHMSDAGRYRCNASNNFSAKTLRSYGYVVAIKPASTSNLANRLLPRMQPQNISIRAGSTLKLNCAGESGRPRWTFIPRQSKIPINLVNFTYQLLFTNVSVDKHEGVYNCSFGDDYQLYNVTVLMLPTFLNNMTSYTSSVVASMSFNCSANGNPAPRITWFKNGREIKNNHIVHFNYPILRINTIDPEDEGLYQCIAKNEAGEASVSMYLSIRDKDRYRRLSRRPESIQCFPIDTTSLYVRFERGLQQMNTDYAMYYLASSSPHSWFSSPPTQLMTNNSLKITGPMVVPFRNYTVYLRTCSVSSVPDAENTGPAGKKQVIPSKLSKGVQCASQGVPVLSIFFSNGIFIWWPRFSGVEPTAYTIQLKHNDTTALPFDALQINGTTQILDDYITHEEVEPLLTKIPITVRETRENVLDESSDKKRRKRRRRAFDSLTGTQLDLESADASVGVAGHHDKHEIKYRQVLVTQLKVPGNVTGVFIPNTKNVNVRILGSTAEDGEPMVQDLHYIQWKTIDTSVRRPDAVNRFQTSHVDVRSVQFTWSRFIATDLLNKCLMLCYKNVNHDVFIRGGSNRINCVNIPKDAMHFNLVGLLPFTSYKAFLKPCYSKEPISDVLDFLTKQDVPGPVTNHGLIRKDGITLTWGPPENRNGQLQGYLIQWIDKDNVNHSVKLTIDTNHFQFPNVSTDDKINISIMAIGSTGVGIPIYVKMMNQIVEVTEPEPQEYIPWIEIGIGAFMVIFLLLFCCILVIHRKNCKKAQRNQAAAATTSALQMHPVNCNADIHEMQTLIGTSEQLPVLIPNGTYKQPESQLPSSNQQSAHTFGSNRFPHANSNPSSNNPETQNGKSRLLFLNRNGLLQKPTNSSSACASLLPLQKPTLPSHVLGSSINEPLNPVLKINSSSSNLGEEPEPKPIAISSNSIYRSTNSSYQNNDGHCEEPRGGYNVSGGCPQHMTLTTGDPNQLQPIHSYRPAVTTTSSLATTAPTVLAINAISTTAEREPSSAATSTSASNLSSTSIRSNGSSSCSVQSQQQQEQQSVNPQLQQPQHRTVKYGSSYDPGSNGVDLAAAVRITENPQYLKNKATPAGYHSPAAVLNTSLFDSSQRRLLDLTIDSNSIELYDDDDVTNCDQNDDANQSNTSTHNLPSSECSSLPHHHHHHPQQQQLSVRMRLAPASESDLEETECNNNNNNNEHQRAGYHSGCLRLSPLHRQHLLNSSSPPCGGGGGNHNECVLTSHDEEDDDLHHLEELDNSSSLLNESSLSTKPLHQQHTSSWNFRRPIVGPNG
ncbi:uncharacterized protein LOC134204852 isoform X2 [Armigeres subalbatus]|uniref:uncharacterized protein LOC134204852 isoform X2 n=1 Tax=Armigeres subalbatus TaxID=124917 RepID=UPI002ED0CC04